jgi:hypothetical protein
MLVRKVRVPLAIPLCSGPTEFMIAQVFGELKMPLPAPTTIISTAICQ